MVPSSPSAAEAPRPWVPYVPPTPAERVQQQVELVEHIAARRAGLRQQQGALWAAPGYHRRVLEIGCGHGHWLAAYATAHPDTLCVGLDLQSGRLSLAQKKAERARLANARFVRAEAEEFIAVLHPALLCDDVYVLFPDPWPKLRHHKHRLLQPSFLRALAPHLAPGGHLYFRTDHEGYAEWTRALLRDPAQGWQIVADGAPLPWETPTVFQRRAATWHTLAARPVAAP